MSTVIAFAPSRPRRAARLVADVVPIAEARAARDDRAALAARGTAQARRQSRSQHTAGSGLARRSGPAGAAGAVGFAGPAGSVEVDWAQVTGTVPLRLTRRGRLIVGAGLALLLAVVIGVAVLLIGHQALAGDQARPVPATYRMVLPGQTLWSIAGQVAPGADRRDTVDRIVEFNALPSVAVQAGQRLAIPADVIRR